MRNPVKLYVMESLYFYGQLVVSSIYAGQQTRYTGTYLVGYFREEARRA